MNFAFSPLLNGSRWATIRPSSSRSRRASVSGIWQPSVKKRDHSRPLSSVTSCGLIGSICQAPSMRSLYVWTWPFGTRTVSAQMPLGSPRNATGRSATGS